VAIERIDGLYAGLDRVPASWGGFGTMSLFSTGDAAYLPDLTGKTSSIVYIAPEIKALLTALQIQSIVNRNWTII
jgi:hypothetical protein